jgi:hypothetical protein
VVCLDCGKQFSYDPKEMRLGRAIEPGQESSLAMPDDDMSPAGRFKRAMTTVVPTIVVFFLAIFGIKRQRSQR